MIGIPSTAFWYISNFNLLLVLLSAWTGGEDKKFDEIIKTEKKNYLYKIACLNNNKVSRVVRVVVLKVMKSRETRYIHVHQFTRTHLFQ